MGSIWDGLFFCCYLDPCQTANSFPILKSPTAEALSTLMLINLKISPFQCLLIAFHPHRVGVSHYRKQRFTLLFGLRKLISLNKLLLFGSWSVISWSMIFDLLLVNGVSGLGLVLIDSWCLFRVYSSLVQGLCWFITAMFPHSWKMKWCLKWCLNCRD